jgi:hypothetical protein
MAQSGWGGMRGGNIAQYFFDARAKLLRGPVKRPRVADGLQKPPFNIEYFAAGIAVAQVRFKRGPLASL